MTDARIPERYLLDRRVARLSDSAFRAWVTSTLWSVANRTDGEIERDDLALIPRIQPEDADTLVASGLWTATAGGWQITDYIETQTSRSELEALESVRRREREKKRAQRARTTDDADMSRGQSTGTVPHASRGATQDRQDRQVLGVSSALVGGREGAPPPASCSRHPNGTDAPCGACGRARVAREEWEAAEARRPKSPRPHEHAGAGDGTCFRPSVDGQPCLARREAVSA